MRAIQVTHHGGPEVLNYGTVDDPIPAPDEVIARTSAIGVNFIDTYLRRGMYPSTPPYVPGTEGAGEIIAVGSDCLLYTSPSPRDGLLSRMPSSA